MKRNSFATKNVGSCRCRERSSERAAHHGGAGRSGERCPNRGLRQRVTMSLRTP